MSIVTRRGDQGTTEIMYRRRVSKAHVRVEACGNIDELNAALGLVRSTTSDPFLLGSMASVQQDLIAVMGELATDVQDLDRYAKDGFHTVSAEFTGRLDQLARTLESAVETPRGWALPGGSRVSACLDLARTICRRAERGVVRLLETEPSNNPEILVYLNRLSDCLWLLARRAETESAQCRSDSVAESGDLR